MAERITSAKPVLRLSYEWFAEARHPESGIPVGFVPLGFLFEEGIVKFSEGYKLHDVGVGRGKSTEYFLSRIPSTVRDSIEVVASEPYIENYQALKSCVGESVRIVAKDAIDAIREEQNCDGISIINAIHLIPEDQRLLLLGEGSHSLKRDGQLWASTTFIEEGIPKQEEPFFERWMRNIYRSLSSFNESTRAILEKVKDSKLAMWSSKRYQDVFEKAGFKIDAFKLETMPCTLKSIRGICHYPVFTSHILPGVDSKKAAVIAVTALKKTWNQMDRGRDDVSPRNTLVIVGRKAA